MIDRGFARSLHDPNAGEQKRNRRRRPARTGLILLILGSLSIGLSAAPARAQDDIFSDRLEEIRRIDQDQDRAAACADLLRQDPPPGVAAACRCVLLLVADQPDSAQRQANLFFGAGTHLAPGGLLILDELDRRSRAVQVGKVIRRLAEAAPDEPVIQARWGGISLVRGDTAQAARCAEETAHRRGDFVAATRRLIRTYGRWERFSDATVLLYRLAPRVDTPAEYAAVQRDLGFAALGAGDTLQARVSWQEADRWGSTREIRDALAFLRRLRDLPSDQREPRATARAQDALGWSLTPSPQLVRRLEEMRLGRESCLVHPDRAAEWSRGAAPPRD